MAANIQFLRSTVPHLRPFPHDLSLGTPMVNVNDDDPGLYFRSSEGNLLKIGPVHVGVLAPNDPLVSPAGMNPNLCVGEQWLNMRDATRPKMLTWNGSEWLEDANANLVYVQEKEPTAVSVEDTAFWFKPSSRELFLRDNDGWLDIQRRPHGPEKGIQYQKNEEFHADAKFTYDDALNQLTIGSILFPDGGVFDGAPGEDYEVQFKLGKNFSTSSNFTFNSAADRLTVLGHCTLGNKDDLTPSDLVLDGTTRLNGMSMIGRNNTDVLLVNSQSMFYSDLTIGNGTGGSKLQVQCPAEFDMAVQIGKPTENEMLTINSTVITSNAMLIGTDNSHEVVVGSQLHLLDSVTLDNAATLNQWYIERLSNVEMTTPHVGDILVHGPGNKWYNEAPGAGPYGNVVEEAPMDGQKYVRQNGAWVVA